MFWNLLPFILILIGAYGIAYWHVVVQKEFKRHKEIPVYSRKKTDLTNNDIYVLFNREVDSPFVIFPIFHGTLFFILVVLAMSNASLETALSFLVFSSGAAYILVASIITVFSKHFSRRTYQGKKIRPYGVRWYGYRKKYKFGCSNLFGFYPAFHLVQLLLTLPISIFTLQQILVYGGGWQYSGKGVFIVIIFALIVPLLIIYLIMVFLVKKTMIIFGNGTS